MSKENEQGIVKWKVKEDLQNSSFNFKARPNWKMKSMFFSFLSTMNSCWGYRTFLQSTCNIA